MYSNKMVLTKNLIKIFKLILVFSFLTIYLSLNQIFEFNSLGKIIIIFGILFLYVILAILLNRQRKTIPSRIIIQSKIPKTQKRYLGSKQTNTYHKNNCRFSKLIKINYKIENDHKEYFKKLNFIPCKICKPNLQ